MIAEAEMEKKVSLKGVVVIGMGKQNSSSKVRVGKFIRIGGAGGQRTCAGSSLEETEDGS